MTCGLGQRCSVVLYVLFLDLDFEVDEDMYCTS